MTGKWAESEDAETLLAMDKDDEAFGDFEDLETGQVVSGKFLCRPTTRINTLLTFRSRVLTFRSRVNI